MNQLGNNSLRMSVVKWLGRHLAIDIGETLTANEYNLIMKTLRATAKNGEVKKEEGPQRLVDGRTAADQLSISYSQFRALLENGTIKIPKVMLGKKTVRFRQKDLDNLVLSDEIENGVDDDNT